MFHLYQLLAISIFISYNNINLHRFLEPLNPGSLESLEVRISSAKSFTQMLHLKGGWVCFQTFTKRVFEMFYG